jgi:hypothetical protein
VVLDVISQMISIMNFEVTWVCWSAKLMCFGQINTSEADNVMRVSRRLLGNQYQEAWQQMQLHIKPQDVSHDVCIASIGNQYSL